MQLKKTLPLLILAGVTLASCTKPAEEAAPLPMVLPEAVTPAEDSGAAAETAVPAVATEQAVPAVESGAVNVTVSGASATVNPDGSANVSIDGAMTTGNAPMAAPGVTVGTDGSVTVDTGAASGATMGQ